VFYRSCLPERRGSRSAVRFRYVTALERIVHAQRTGKARRTARGEPIYRLDRNYSGSLTPATVDARDVEAFALRIYLAGDFGASAGLTYRVSVGPTPVICTSTGSAPVRAK
jgi:hypothetical protein